MQQELLTMSHSPVLEHVDLPNYVKGPNNGAFATARQLDTWADWMEDVAGLGVAIAVLR
jgi:hypothetical protein